MNIAEWSIRNNVITWVMTVLMVVVGVVSFTNSACWKTRSSPSRRR